MQIQVCDRGQGFGAVDPERIFEPFFTTKDTGLGMGLSISRAIAHAHGGRLTPSGQAIDARKRPTAASNSTGRSTFAAWPAPASTTFVACGILPAM